MAVNLREELIKYCLRKLGSPVIEINVDPDQAKDRVDEALDYYQEYHSDATVRTFFKHQVTDSDATTSSQRSDCYMEDVQYLNGQAKYTSNFTPPTASLSSSIQ